jgi:hypothetical protein
MKFYDVIQNMDIVAVVYVTAGRWLSQYDIIGAELRQYKMSIF